MSHLSKAIKCRPLQLVTRIFVSDLDRVPWYQILQTIIIVCNLDAVLVCGNRYRSMIKSDKSFIQSSNYFHHNHLHNLTQHLLIFGTYFKVKTICKFKTDHFWKMLCWAFSWLLAWVSVGPIVFSEIVNNLLFWGLFYSIVIAGGDLIIKFMVTTSPTWWFWFFLIW